MALGEQQCRRGVAAHAAQAGARYITHTRIRAMRRVAARWSCTAVACPLNFLPSETSFASSTQDYIQSVEQAAAEQKRELQRVKEEKRGLERVGSPLIATARDRLGTIHALALTLTSRPGVTHAPQVVYRVEVQNNKGPYGEYFSNAELADMPPRLRAIVEDNKALKEKVR